MGARNDEAPEAGSSTTSGAGGAIGESGTRGKSGRPEPTPASQRVAAQSADEHSDSSAQLKDAAQTGAQSSDAPKLAPTKPNVELGGSPRDGVRLRRSEPPKLNVSDVRAFEMQSNSARLSRPPDDIEPHVAITVASIPPPAPPKSPPSSSRPPPSRPSIAGRYRLDSRLAEGGMGIIYSGWHVTLDQPVAVKVIRKELVDNADAVQRFIEEARALAQLRGPHVAQVLDAGIEDGSPFIVMELLEGRDLRTLLEEYQRLTPERAVELVREACEAVAEAHSKGIVHRDLKPENLFLVDAEDGRCTLKVIDFGISARRGGDGAYTEQVLGPGSPEYMAPEQLLPGKFVDHRADVWSLGIVLFELLAGAVPFSGETPHEICSGVVAGEMPSLKSRGVEIPEGLEAIISRCLSKSADDRFNDALELAVALVPFAGLAAERSLTPPGHSLKPSGHSLKPSGHSLKPSGHSVAPFDQVEPSSSRHTSDNELFAEDARVLPQSIWVKAKSKSQIAIGLAAGCLLSVAVYATTQGASQQEPSAALADATPANEPKPSAASATPLAGPKVVPVLGEEAEATNQAAQRTVRSHPGPLVPPPAPVGVAVAPPRDPAVVAADEKLDSELDSIGEEVSPLVENSQASGEQAAEARYALAASAPKASEKKAAQADDTPAAEAEPDPKPPAQDVPSSAPAKVSFPDTK